MSVETVGYGNEQARRKYITLLASKAIEAAGVDVRIVIGEGLPAFIESVEMLLDTEMPDDELLNQGWSETRLKFARGLAEAYRNQAANEFVVNQDDDSEDDIFETATTEDAHVVLIDSVRAYLNRIGKVDLLDAADEVELSKRIEAGVYADHLLQEAQGKDGQEMTQYEGMTVQERRDLQRVQRDGKQAKNHMLEANLRLVVSIAKRYTGRGVPLLDIIQEGNLGLIRAVEKFDYKKGFKFSTYATWWIRQAITRNLSDLQRTIHLPAHMVAAIRKVERSNRELQEDLGRDPTDIELAQKLDITLEKLHEIRQYSREPVSLNQALGDNENSAEVGDTIADDLAIKPDDAVTFEQLQDQLRSVLGTLSEREASVIRLRFGLDNGNPMTLADIGELYGVTRERIRQIEAKTMRKLRDPSRAEVLRDYLE